LTRPIQFSVERAAPPHIPSRDFLPWRFSYAGRRRARHCLRAAGIRKPSQKQTSILVEFIQSQCNSKRAVVCSRDQAASCPTLVARLQLGSQVLGIQRGGGGGCFGFGPNARSVSRCGRLTFDIASCRAYSWSPTSLYC